MSGNDHPQSVHPPSQPFLFPFDALADPYPTTYLSPPPSPLPLPPAGPGASSVTTPTPRPAAREQRRATSKRYRDTLVSLYNSLASLVPTVLPDARPRTKSQIISAASLALSALDARAAAAAARANVHAPAARAAFADASVRRHNSLAAVLADAAHLLTDYAWDVGEVWLACAPGDSGIGGGNDDDDVRRHLAPARARAHAHNVTAYGLYASLTAGAESGEDDDALTAFVASSADAVVLVGDGSLVARAAETHDAAWAVVEAFRSFAAAKSAGFVVACAVPCRVRSEVRAVLLLYNRVLTPHALPHLAVAVDVVAEVGSYWGNKHLLPEKSTYPL